MLKKRDNRTLALLAAIGLLLAAPALAQMGGNMGGAGGGGGGAITQGYITAPPPPQPVTGTPTQPGGPAQKQADQPDKCKTCENCLTEQCRSMCWRRYCRQ